MREIETKGSAIRSLLLAIEALWGADVVKRTIEACPEEVRTALSDGRLVPGGWYPVGWYREIHAKLRTIVPDDERISAKIGRKTTEQDLKGPMRWLLSLAGADLIARFAGKIHGSYFRGGTIDVERKPGRLVFRMVEMHGMNKHLWDDLVAGTAMVFEAAARHTVQQRVVGGTGPTIELTLIWDEAEAAARA